MIKRFNIVSPILIGGYLGILAFSGTFYLLTWLIARQAPHDGFYGIWFPYVTHPIGYAIGSAFGAKLAVRHNEVMKLRHFEKLRKRLIVAGTITCFFGASVLLLVTGPPLMVICDVIDNICQRFIR